MSDLMDGQVVPKNESPDETIPSPEQQTPDSGEHPTEKVQPSAKRERQQSLPSSSKPKPKDFLQRAMEVVEGTSPLATPPASKKFKSDVVAHDHDDNDDNDDHSDDDNDNEGVKEHSDTTEGEDDSVKSNAIKVKVESNNADVAANSDAIKNETKTSRPPSTTSSSESTKKNKDSLLLYTDNIAAACAALNENTEREDWKRQEQQQKRIFQHHHHHHAAATQPFTNMPLQQQTVASPAPAAAIASNLLTSSSYPTATTSFPSSFAFPSSLLMGALGGAAAAAATGRQATPTAMAGRGSIGASSHSNPSVDFQQQQQSSQEMRTQNMMLQQENLHLKHQVLSLKRQVLELLAEREQKDHDIKIQELLHQQHQQQRLQQQQQMTTASSAHDPFAGMDQTQLSLALLLRQQSMQGAAPELPAATATASSRGDLIRNLLAQRRQSLPLGDQRAPRNESGNNVAGHERSARGGNSEEAPGLSSLQPSELEQLLAARFLHTNSSTIPTTEQDTAIAYRELQRRQQQQLLQQHELQQFQQSQNPFQMRQNSSAQIFEHLRNSQQQQPHHRRSGGDGDSSAGGAAGNSTNGGYTKS